MPDYWQLTLELSGCGHDALQITATDTPQST